MERQSSADPGQVLTDPIGKFVEATRQLNEVRDEEFGRQWLLRALYAEITRYSMEDDYIDTESAAFQTVTRAFTDLIVGDDWMHPKVERLLVACRAVAGMPELERDLVERHVRQNGSSFDLLECVARSTPPIRVSNREARVVPIIEDNLGSPKHCSGVVDAFAARVAKLVREAGVTHLAFIEKEFGPVGAISMMSSIVALTGLPACIYRETHWAQRAALAASRPGARDRIAILYDLIVTGAGIRHAADAIRELTGAVTVGAVLLCGYGERRSTVKSEAGQEIAIEALTWNDSAPVATPSRRASEARNGSEPRTAQREELSMKAPKDDRPSVRIPPGFYTPETLPPLSSGAKRILERVRLRADRAKGQKTQQTSADAHIVGLRLTDEGTRVGLPLTSKEEKASLRTKK